MDGDGMSVVLSKLRVKCCEDLMMFCGPIMIMSVLSLLSLRKL